MNYNSLFSKYIDKFNLITQRREAGADGGDTCHRVCNILLCAKLDGTQYSFDNKPLIESYYRCIGDFEITKDVYRRHPDTTKWYSLPENFSADQATMLLAAMLAFGDTERLKGFGKKLIERKGFHQNTHPNYEKPGDKGYVTKIADIVRPSQIAIILRGMRAPVLYPLIFVLDLFLFIDIILNMFDDYRSRKKGKRTDAYTMMTAILLTTKLKYDTLPAKLVRKLMRFTDYKSAITWIFEPAEHNDPPIHKILLPLCEKYIDKDEKIIID